MHGDIFRRDIVFYVVRTTYYFVRASYCRVHDDLLSRAHKIICCAHKIISRAHNINYLSCLRICALRGSVDMSPDDVSGKIYIIYIHCV